MAVSVAYDDLRVCGECAQILANGEIRDGREDDGASVAAAQVEQWGELARGLVLTGDEPTPFSKAQCDGCGTTLAGERWDAAVLLD